jgi:Amino acid permease
MQSPPTTALEPVDRRTFPASTSFTSDDASSYYRQSRGADVLSGGMYVAPGEEAGTVEKEDTGTGRGKQTPFFDRFDLWFGGGRDLKLVSSLVFFPAPSPWLICIISPVLGRRHIFMISIGGTIGMGLVLTSGEVLRLSGSTGVIVAYALMGVVIAAVMSCIAEMVSLIPEAGAITLFPSRFGDASLGFAVGVGYW